MEHASHNPHRNSYLQVSSTGEESPLFRPAVHPHGDDPRQQTSASNGFVTSSHYRPCFHCDDRLRTTILINISAIIERVDEQLLPALYRFVGASFNAKPTQLGNLTLARSLAQALASPAAGILGHRCNRILVLCGGALLWGTMTVAFGFSNSVAAGLFLWACNGIGLSFMIPSAQSLTADYNPESRRGRAFGFLHLVGAVGALVGALFATNVGHVRVLGLQGWRFAFLTVAMASWIIGLATWLFGVDPRYSKDPRYALERSEEDVPVSTGEGVKAALKQMGDLVTIPTFMIIVLQGIVGTTPWYEMTYLIHLEVGFFFFCVCVCVCFVSRVIDKMSISIMNFSLSLNAFFAHNKPLISAGQHSTS
jgi:MFS family permease